MKKAAAGHPIGRRRRRSALFCWPFSAAVRAVLGGRAACNRHRLFVGELPAAAVPEPLPTARRDGRRVDPGEQCATAGLSETRSPCFGADRRTLPQPGAVRETSHDASNQLTGLTRLFVLHYHARYIK